MQIPSSLLGLKFSLQISSGMTLHENFYKKLPSMYFLSTKFWQAEPTKNYSTVINFGYQNFHA